MSTERWVCVPGFPEYEVSDQGRVRSRKTYHGVRPPRLIAQEVDRYGYPFVRFSQPGSRTRKRAKVHQLVLAAFVGPRPDDMVARHLNGNPADNRLANLRYGSQSQNIRDAVAHGTHSMSSRTHCKHGHEFTAENTHYKPSKPGRICLTCYRARARDRQRARRAKAKASAA